MITENCYKKGSVVFETLKQLADFNFNFYEFYNIFKLLNINVIQGL